MTMSTLATETDHGPDGTGDPREEWLAAPVSDEELTRQALAADPDAPIAADATPLFGDPSRTGDLPLWYMPAVAARSGGSRRAAIVVLIVVALLVIVGSGLCITYGTLTIA